MLVQSVKWLTFCASNSLTKTIVHFFPSAGQVGAPYTASCSLTLFGGEGEPQTVALEGARLSHPDGVRLDQVFSDLAEGVSGFRGVFVELETQQPRVDLSSSECIIELASPAGSVRFRPKLIAQGATGDERKNCRGLVLSDSLNDSALVIVNGSKESLSPTISGIATDNGGGEGVAVVPPQTVREFLFSTAVRGVFTAVEGRWGVGQVGGLEVGGINKESASFLVYRDARIRRPVSVCQL